MEYLLKAHTLTADLPTGESTQPEDELLLTPDDALEPPVPLEVLRQLTQTSDIRASCIDAIATNTVGLGYTLDVEEGAEHEVADPSADVQKALAQLESLAQRDTRLTPSGSTLTDVLRAVKRDEEEIGWGFIEVSRDQRTGEISGLFHLPAWRMRRLKNRKGFLMLAPDGNLGDAERYYNFGDKARLDDQGKPTGKLIPGRAWARNEVICFKLYTSESRDYGLPRDIAMAVEYAGDKLAKETNVSFFDSSGTPPTIIFVQGDEERDGAGKVSFRVPRETSDRIAATLKSDGGHRSRVAIIPVPPGTKTSAEQLGQISDRDMGFISFRADNARRTISSFRLQPIFVPAIEDQGRYTAEVQRAITLEQLFDPEQRRYEGALGESVLRELGFGHLRIRFKRLAVEDDKTRRESAVQMAENGTITRREFRRAHGYGPLPEGDGDGKVPTGWNDELVDAKTGAAAPGGAPGLDAGIGSRPDSQRQNFLDNNSGHSTSGAKTNGSNTPTPA